LFTIQQSEYAVWVFSFSFEFSTSATACISEVSADLLKEAISKFGLFPEDCRIRPLAGGFMNANFIVTNSDRNFVFRVYSTDRVTAERKRDVLRFLKSYPAKVPENFALFEAHGTPIAVLEYIDGITLEDRILGDEPIDARLYEEIGSQLAHIHCIQFNETGFIGPRMTIGKEYENLSSFIRWFIDKTLNEISADRLDAEIKERFKTLARDKWHVVEQTEPLRQLVHTDFNPKNILVSKPRYTTVVAVIDWEFCVSGNGLADLGNFFRFSYDYAPDAHAHFEEGYRSVNPTFTRSGAMRLDYWILETCVPF
jgi:Ser/Thr protein kinase RdoA (MazF antagonist)